MSAPRKPFAQRRVPPERLHRGNAKEAGTLDLANYQGRRWVTRLGICTSNRLASAWLIKQFIDKRPRFYFVADGETLEDAIPLRHVRS